MTSPPRCGATESSDPQTDLHGIIVEWRATARILADPELTALLTRDYPDEDHGEVFPP
ncbi:hypothetical protein [Streptomyces sp. NBC_01304]|uniref:hypothetical protein n=1 Tax=Streptomyces sp. NBC_01304 TaxID=2903818 RepID=UPI002E0DAAAB|nr:hypothetical protein OG430_28295 [Streptomyces sp. NBC_01304]